MTDPDNLRPLEQGIELDLRDRMTYGGYLQLDTLLTAQKPLSDLVHHYELLFIVQHEVAELWMKLVIHELKAAIARLRADDVDTTLKILARVKQVQRQLFEQWGVLETLTPSEYMEFRPVLGASSGFQSLQYRVLEFLLGNKNADMLRLFEHDPAGQDALREALHEPSLYDEFLRYLAREGYAVPAALLARDVTAAVEPSPELQQVLIDLYRRDTKNTEICERLVDLDEGVQEWRYRHVKMVERTIGAKMGTGGSAGAEYLRTTLQQPLFPDLWEIRARL